MVAFSLIAAACLADPSAWAQVPGGELSALKEHDTVQPIDIAADRFEVRDDENIAVFFGQVEAIQGDMQIYSDTLTVYYETAEGNASPTITRLDVAGSVRVVSPSETAKADWVVYDVVEHLLTLGGDVQLSRGDSEMRGQRLEMDLESGVVRFDSAGEDGPQPGRVHGRFSVPTNEPTDGPTDDPTEDPAKDKEPDKN